MQPLVLRALLQRGLVPISIAHYLLRIVRGVQPAIEGAFVLRLLAQIKRPQKITGHSPHVRKTVWIAIEVAQHDVVLGIQVGVASVFAEDQRI